MIQPVPPKRNFIGTILGLSIGLIVLYFLISGFSALSYWQKNKKDFIDNIMELNSLIRAEAARQSAMEFQLNEYGKVVHVGTTRIFDRNGIVIGEFFPSRHLIVTEEEVPMVLMDAIVAMEDRNFYSHHGIDFSGMIRSFLRSLLHFRITGGGSTITQQLTKILFTTQKRTLQRKLIDIISALTVERRFSKKEILLMYLNTVYFGHGSYGVGSASQLYFGKQVRNLNFSESAMLAGLLSMPNRISPFRDPELARKKQKVALQRMARRGFISQEMIEPAQEGFWKKYGKRFENENVSLWQMKLDKDPWWTDYVRQTLFQLFSEDILYDKPLNIQTTVDFDLQQKVRSITASYLSSISSDTDVLQGAVVVMDPATGGVLAMVGGDTFDEGNQLNRALSMKRQIGSLIKPFLYTTAIEKNGITPSTVMTDKPLAFRNRNGLWTPGNYDGLYDGAITLGDALKKSKNSIAVQLLRGLGVPIFTAELRKIWGNECLLKEQENMTLALGTIELSPLQTAEGYACLARGGVPIHPLLITQVQDYDDNVLKDFQEPVSTNERIFLPESTETIRQMLEQVTSEGGTAYYAAQTEGFKYTIACKTGTTDKKNDAWFAAYNNRVVVITWIGFDHQRRLPGTGGMIAAPLGFRILKAMPGYLE